MSKRTKLFFFFSLLIATFETVCCQATCLAPTTCTTMVLEPQNCRAIDPKKEPAVKTFVEKVDPRMAPTLFASYQGVVLSGVPLKIKERPCSGKVPGKWKELKEKSAASYFYPTSEKDPCRQFSAHDPNHRDGPIRLL